MSMVANLVKRVLPARFSRWNVERILTDALLVMVLVLGWMLINTQNNLDTFTTCTRDYLVKDRKNGDIRLEASLEERAALANALTSVPDLLKPVIELTEQPTPKAQREALAAIRTTNTLFMTYEARYNDYIKASENFPKPPEPNEFCKE